MKEQLGQFLARARTRDGASTRQIDEAARVLGFDFPADYREFLWNTNGATGFAGRELYAIFWRIEELLAFNIAYQANLRVPTLLLFGSTGSGEAFAFDKESSTYPVLLVPFVPLELSKAIKTANSFFELFDSVEGAVSEPSLTDSEIVEIKPIILGGHPTDSKNKTVLNREAHIKYTNYWNNLIQSLRQ